MAQETFFVDEATARTPIEQIERSLHQLVGIERVLVDTADGEVKVEYDSEQITKEQIMQTLQQVQLER